MSATPEIAPATRIKMKIMELYEEEGFLNAKIDPKRYIFFSADTSDDEIIVTWRYENDFSDEYETVYDFNPESSSNLINKIRNRILLKYEIVEGDEVVVRKIEFTGNQAFDDDDLASEFDETTFRPGIIPLEKVQFT